MAAGRDQQVTDLPQFTPGAGDLILGYDATAKATKAMRVDSVSLAYYAPQGEIGVVNRQFPVGNAYRYGAIGDGAAHPLSSVYATLAAAQAVYPFATALTQQIDYCALQAMSNSCLGWNGNEHGNANSYKNLAMTIPGGSYQFGADTWLIRSAVGAQITGAGRLSTKLTGSGIVFGTDGWWFSAITGIAFTSTGAAAAVVDIDGNVPGHPYATLGVQGNSFEDCWIDGSGLATYGFALTRQGNPPGPGAQGSENSFRNCHFNACVTANWYASGFNALQNTFIGGNFQRHQKSGILLNGGAVYLYSVGFQSQQAYTQIVNDGYDVDVGATGVYERIVVDGIRSESLRVVRSGGAQTPLVRGLTHEPAIPAWSANTYALNATVTGITAAGNRKLYRVTTAGTTAGAAPAWPESGTVTDGTVVWTQTDFNAVVLNDGELAFSRVQLGQVSGGVGALVSHSHFTRADAIASNSYLVPLGNDPTILGSFAVNQSNQSRVALTVGNNNAAGARSTKPYSYNLADGALLFTRGVGGGTGFDVGMYGGQSDYNVRAKNTAKMIGALELDSFTFAELNGNATNNGAIVYCSDGLAASNPLTGASTGCLAIRQNGAWKGL